jgi:hypothetical protein
VSAPTFPRMMRLLHAAVVLCVVAALAGCGGGATATSGDALTFEQLSQAAKASADATSGRFEFSFELDVPDTEKPFAFSGTGAFDATSNRAAISLDFSSFAELLGGLLGGFGAPQEAKVPDFGDPSLWQIEAVQDGELVYMRFPAVSSELPAGKSWVRMNADEAGGAQGFNFSQLQDATSNDPREMLEFLRAATGGIETVGREELRGVGTTHYRATVDMEEYEKLVPADKRSMAEDLLEQTALGEIPVDVWLDDHGLVRQVEMSFAATQPGANGTAEGSMRFELYDYGKVIDVDLPPADEVVDAAAVD